MVAQLQREDGPATAKPDERTQTRSEQRADASHVAPPVFSIVAPVYNEEETLPHFYRRVVDVMEGLGESFELVLVNDAKVDYAQRHRRRGETRFKLLTAAAFYRLIARVTAMDIPRDTGDFRLLDRRVVDTLVTMREHHRFMRGLSVWVGFRQEAVPYDRQERFAGVTKYPLGKMVRFALDAITGFSYVPLQLASTLGFLLAGLNLLGILLAAVL